jgi:hypothetical protein
MAQVWLRLADNYEADSYEAANKMVGRPEAEEFRPRSFAHLQASSM